MAAVSINGLMNHVSYVYISDVVEAEKEKPAPSGDDHVFIAFARVYSGTVKKGQRLYVLGPKHNPGKAIEEVRYFSC